MIKFDDMASMTWFFGNWRPLTVGVCLGALLALDEYLDALVTLDGVMEPLEMVIMHEKVWHPHKWWHDDPCTLYVH